MFKSIFLYSLLILFPTLIIGQNTFSKTIDINNDADSGWQIEEVEDGYMILSGSRCINNSTSCVGLVKTDFDGEVIWKKNYSSHTNNLGSGRFVKDGNDYLISGRINTPNDSLDFFLLKIANNGDSLWMRTYGTQKLEFNKSVIKTLDGGYILYGIQEINEIQRIILLIKLNENYDIEWEKNYGEEFRFADGAHILQLNNGDFLMSARTCLWGESCIQPAAALIRIDSIGNEIWTKTFEQVGKDVTHPRVIDLDNGNIAYSWVRDSFNFETYEYPPVVYGLNPDGDIIWEKTLYSSWVHEKNILNLRKASNGDILGVGWDQTIEGFNAGGWIFRLTPNGELLWERTIAEPGSVIEYTPLFDIMEDQDGSLLACGNYQDSFPDGIPVINNPNIWLLKLDNMGCLEPDCEEQQLITSTIEIQQEDRSLESLTIFPNPVKNKIRIHLSNPSLFREESTTKIFNNQGQLIYQISSPTFPIDINVIDFASGIYWIQMHNNKGLFATSKFIKS